MQAVAAALVAAVGAFGTGCFGKFQLTRKLYEVNRSVEDKYLRSAVTWLFVVPYGLTAFLDFVVFNVIEFWSGENPVAAGPSSKTYLLDGGQAAMTVSRDGAATVAVLETFDGGRRTAVLVVRDDGRGRVTAEYRPARGSGERLEALAREDGSVVVTRTGASGTERLVHPREAVETAARRAARTAFGPPARPVAGGGPSPSGLLARRAAFSG